MEKLLRKIEKMRNEWDEVSNFTIKGVNNLSRADLDLICLYARTAGAGLRRPVGAVAEVLEKYGYEHRG